MGDFERVVDPQPCVSCGRCAFTFHADHTDGLSRDYSCPACNEKDLTAENARLKLEVEAFRKALEALLIVRRLQSPEALPLDCLVLCNAALGAAK